MGRNILLPNRCDVVLAYYVADVGRGSVLQQQQDDVQVTHEGCHVDRSQTRLDAGSEEVMMMNFQKQTLDVRVSNRAAPIRY